MNFDYSKTINEQLATFNYYKDRYCSYELELINDRKEIKRLNNIINELEDIIVGKINVLYQISGQSNAIQELNILLRQLRELKGSDKE